MRHSGPKPGCLWVDGKKMINLFHISQGPRSLVELFTLENPRSPQQPEICGKKGTKSDISPLAPLRQSADSTGKLATESPSTSWFSSSNYLCQLPKLSLTHTLSLCFSISITSRAPLFHNPQNLYPIHLPTSVLALDLRPQNPPQQKK